MDGAVEMDGARSAEKTDLEQGVLSSASCEISTIGPLLLNRQAQSAHSLLGHRSHLDSGKKGIKEHRKSAKAKSNRDVSAQKVRTFSLLKDSY